MGHWRQWFCCLVRCYKHGARKHFLKIKRNACSYEVMLQWTAGIIDGDKFFHLPTSCGIFRLSQMSLPGLFALLLFFFLDNVAISSVWLKYFRGEKEATKLLHAVKQLHRFKILSSCKRAEVDRGGNFFVFIFGSKIGKQIWMLFSAVVQKNYFQICFLNPAIYSPACYSYNGSSNNP